MNAYRALVDGEYIPVARIATKLEWRVERTRRWLLREGVVFKKGRLWYTTPARLEAAFPEVFDALYAGKFEN